MTAVRVSARPGTAREGEARAVPTLHEIARQLHLPCTTQLPTWDQLLDHAAGAYWTNRRPQSWRCAVGSEPGYLTHLRSSEIPCDRCRQAHAMCRQIRRLRQTRRAPLGRAS